MPGIAVLTSGGDAPGMNAALHAIVKLCAARGVDVMGVEQGYDGLMAGRFRPLRPQDVDGIGHMGGTLLGSARSKGFRTPAGRARAAQALESLDGLLVIGGNGSLTGAHLLAQETGVRVIGLPASIDNDLGCTASAIGVDTALNTIVDACDRIADTARAHRRVFVVEVMGRQCGYLAMASSIAVGADACLYREQGKGEAHIVAELEALLRRAYAPERNKLEVLILKAEGVELPTPQLVRRLQDFSDRELGGVDVRGTVLGHVVRGGNPSYQDRMIAGRLSAAAVGALLGGSTDEMVGWQPWTEGGIDTRDPSVKRFGLAQVLDETRALLDGTSPVTQRRVRQMETYAGVMGI
ncbi:MAG: 6-phosphofructokinase [Alphaproteobacteria bacterium]|nr:6-phosphofructokinase [Alphaproteobacteria bacterium]